MASHIQNALIQSPYSSPDIQYKVSYTATRIDNSNVRYDFTIQSLLQGYSQTSFRTGKILNCSITIGGVSNSVTLKDSNEIWSGGSGGTTGEGALKSTEYISITCPSSSGGEWQTVTFNVTRGDSGGNSGKVSTSDYYVISPDLLWTAAGGATVDHIIDNGDNTITVTCTMGADGYNNAVYNVHIYGFVDRSDGIPSYGDHDFSASDGSISGRTVTFTIPAPSSKSSYMVRICAYSISQKGDNPGGNPVNSGTINRYSVFTIAYDANGGTGAPASHSLSENEWGTLSTQIPTRNGYKFIGWQDHNDYTYDGVTYPWYAFDAPFYANTYGDVFAAYDYDKYNLIQHWVGHYVYSNSNGGHNYSSQLFHLQYYYDTNYSEFSPHFGTYKLNYVKHWIKNGYSEGKSGISNVINDNNDVYPAGANVRRLGTEGQTVVLTAKWEPVLCTVTFDPNGGSLPNPGGNLYQIDGPNPENKVTIPYNERMYAVMPNDIPTRSGYIFDGWNTESDGSGTQVYGADGLALGEGTYYTPGERWVYPGDVTLYAQWQQAMSQFVNINNTWVPCTIKVNMIGPGYVFLGTATDFSDLQDFDLNMYEKYGIYGRDLELAVVQDYEDLDRSDTHLGLEIIQDWGEDAAPWEIYLKSNNVLQWIECNIENIH